MKCEQRMLLGWLLALKLTSCCQIHQRAYAITAILCPFLPRCLVVSLHSELHDHYFRKSPMNFQTTRCTCPEHSHRRYSVCKRWWERVKPPSQQHRTNPPYLLPPDRPQPKKIEKHHLVYSRRVNVITVQFAQPKCKKACTVAQAAGNQYTFVYSYLPVMVFVTCLLPFLIHGTKSLILPSG